MSHWKRGTNSGSLCFVVLNTSNLTKRGLSKANILTCHFRKSPSFAKTIYDSSVQLSVSVSHWNSMHNSSALKRAQLKRKCGHYVTYVINYTCAIHTCQHICCGKGILSDELGLYFTMALLLVWAIFFRHLWSKF